jgi:hypothetical protein
LEQAGDLPFSAEEQLLEFAFVPNPSPDRRGVRSSTTSSEHSRRMIKIGRNLGLPVTATKDNYGLGSSYYNMF